MADTPQSSPLPEPERIPASEGIVPPAPSVAVPRPALAPPAPPKPTLREWAVYRLGQGAAFVVLWVVAAAFLCRFFEVRTFDSFVLGAVLSVVLGFFLRPMLPLTSPADKYRAAGGGSSDRIPNLSADKPDADRPREGEPVREVIETIVFVVVLVLMLKTFVAEAFVIPTGSMAETLFGYQKQVTCPQCGYTFPVNCSIQADAEAPSRTYVSGCTCPNCRQQIKLVPPPPDGTPVDPKALPANTVLDGETCWCGSTPLQGWRSGDRVLVSKFVYDMPGGAPERMDVVVFKFPGEHTFPNSGPIKNHSPMNYIKRLIGRPGEVIAIFKGKIYVLSPEKVDEFGLTKLYDDQAKAEGDPNKLARLWQPAHTYRDDSRSVALFDRADSPFEIYRKPAEQVKSMMRIVFDYDHQPKDVNGPAGKRWAAEEKGGWKEAGKTSFAHEGGGDKMGWLRYRHVLRGSDRPSLITDFLGYNTYEPHPGSAPRPNWAGDLIVECDVEVKQAGSLALELSKGASRFRATFDLKTGGCVLTRHKDGKTEELGKADTRMRGKGTYSVRFANADDRLLVWVDGRLPFGQGVAYAGDRRVVPTKENDLDAPASVGSEGAGVTVSSLKVFRDTYYTSGHGGGPGDADAKDWTATDPDTFAEWGKVRPTTMYVQPGHFLCLGDNSPESSDGRTWGLVPRRLMLGKAVLVYYPFQRGGRIR